LLHADSGRRRISAAVESRTPVTLDDWQRHALRHLFYVPLIPLRDQL